MIALEQAKFIFDEIFKILKKKGVDL